MPIHTVDPQLPDWMFMQMPLVSGRFYTAPPWGNTITTLPVLANSAFLVPFGNPRPVTWATIAIEVTSAVAGNCMLGAYYLGSDGYPGTLLKQFGTVSTGGTGAQSLTITQFVPQGWWWLVAAFSAAATVRALSGLGGEFPLSALNGTEGGTPGFRITGVGDWVTALPYRLSLSATGGTNLSMQGTAPRVLIGI